MIFYCLWRVDAKIQTILQLMCVRYTHIFTLPTLQHSTTNTTREQSQLGRPPFLCTWWQVTMGGLWLRGFGLKFHSLCRLLPISYSCSSLWQGQQARMTLKKKPRPYKRWASLALMTRGICILSVDVNKNTFCHSRFESTNSTANTNEPRPSALYSGWYLAL